MKILRLSWRNIWRNRRRTLVTVGATTLALVVMIVYTSLMQGYLADMEGSILDVEIGDVQIHAPDYRDNPSIYSVIESPDLLLEELREAGYRAAARLVGGGLVAASDSSSGASLIGIDIESDARVSEVHTW